MVVFLLRLLDEAFRMSSPSFCGLELSSSPLRSSRFSLLMLLAESSETALSESIEVSLPVLDDWSFEPLASVVLELVPAVSLSRYP